MAQVERGSELVLALDTCGASSTLALGHAGESGVTVTAQVVLPPRTAGTQLTGALRELFGAAGPAGLRAIVVVRGPGSFTGMRIGLSAAKALCEATGAPIVALSRLAILAASSGTRAVAFDAGRGRVYLRPGSGEERLASAAEAHAQMTSTTDGDMAVCEGRVAALFPEARLVEEPTATDALRYAWARVEAGDWDDPATLDALYLWRPEEMLTQPVPAK